MINFENSSPKDTTIFDLATAQQRTSLATNLLFSGLGKGYINREGKAVLQTKPDRTLTLLQVYQYIVSDDAKNATNQLRQITDHRQAQEFKKLNFRVALFGGIFSKRNARDIAQQSGALTIDIDGIESAEEVERIIDLLIHDPRLKVLLCFRSPSGNGIKCIVLIDRAKNLAFKAYFNWVYRYFIFEYDIEIDTSGSDICRACYLPHDPKCYINQEYITPKHTISYGIQ